MSKTTTNNIELNISSKREYTINGDKSKILKLNPNDMGIIARTSDAIAMINELETDYTKLFNEPEEKTSDDMPSDVALTQFSTKFKQLDAGIREAVNFLFDYDVCSVCADEGSMFDLQDGEYRYAVIIDTLMPLYADTITEETNKMITKMQKKVEKYVNRDHKRKRTK
jgi:hypothetical protein